MSLLMAYKLICVHLIIQSNSIPNITKSSFLVNDSIMYISLKLFLLLHKHAEKIIDRDSDYAPNLNNLPIIYEEQKLNLDQSQWYSGNIAGLSAGRHGVQSSIPGLGE